MFQSACKYQHCTNESSNRIELSMKPSCDATVLHASQIETYNFHMNLLRLNECYHSIRDRRQHFVALFEFAWLAQSDSTPMPFVRSWKTILGVSHRQLNSCQWRFSIGKNLTQLNCHSVRKMSVGISNAIRLFLLLFRIKFLSHKKKYWKKKRYYVFQWWIQSTQVMPMNKQLIKVGEKKSLGTCDAEKKWIEEKKTSSELHRL